MPRPLLKGNGGDRAGRRKRQSLVEKHCDLFGQGITAEKMKDCRWLRPVLVGQFEFVEWTPDHHLRHSTFVGLREDKDAKDVVRET